MAASLSKFGPEALLLGLKVFVPGTSPELTDITRDDAVLFVTLCQGDAIQQSRLVAPPDAWTVEVPSTGFGPGPAVATALLVVPVPSAPFGSPPGGYGTTWWSDTVELTTESLGAPPASG